MIQLLLIFCSFLGYALGSLFGCLTRHYSKKALTDRNDASIYYQRNSAIAELMQFISHLVGFVLSLWSTLGLVWWEFLKNYPIRSNECILLIWLAVGAIFGLPLTRHLRSYVDQHDTKWYAATLQFLNIYLHFFFIIPSLVFLGEYALNIKKKRTRKRESKEAGQEVQRRSEANTIMIQSWTGLRLDMGPLAQVLYSLGNGPLRTSSLEGFEKLRKEMHEEDRPRHWVGARLESEPNRHSVYLIKGKGSAPHSTWKTYAMRAELDHSKPDNWYWTIKLRDAEGLIKVIKVPTPNSTMTEEQFLALMAKLLNYVNQYNSLRHEFDAVIAEKVAPQLQKGQGAIGNSTELQLAREFLEAGPAILTNMGKASVRVYFNKP